MCELLVDVQVEVGSSTPGADDPMSVQCESGRVIIAVSAWAGNTSTAKPLPAELHLGALSDTCTIYPTGNATSGLFSPIVVHWSLTTARVATL